MQATTDLAARGESIHTTQAGPDPGVIDGVDLRALATRVPTPVHAYSARAIRAKAVMENRRARTPFAMDCSAALKRRLIFATSG